LVKECEGFENEVEAIEDELVEGLWLLVAACDPLTELWLL
jgi:hypothetical protein